MASCSKTMQLTLSVLLFFHIKCVLGADVLTLKGFVNGTSLTTRNGRNIEAFLGIPYAKPPVGWRRFKSPVEMEPWDDVLATDTDREQCPQLYDGRLVGKEDCLFLNVYTPNVLTLETKYIYPTMVFFHGGNFVRGNGSSTMAGPEYLLDKNIVLVTVQYRLGALGFLSTDDLQAPGNFGLKDQALALKWVQDNIVFFGGDADKVTIFGQDAGGVSAQLHSLSDVSAGLFHRYISQSGTSLCLWAYVDPEDCKDNAAKLGRHLNCSTTNSKDLVNCLRKADVKNLVDSDYIFGDKTYVFKTWGPTVEPPHHGAFLSMFAYYKVTADETHGHRAIIGNVANEGLALTAKYYSDPGAYQKFANNTDSFIQHILSDLFNFPASEVYVEEVKEFYFNGTNPSDKETFINNMTSMISDTFFVAPADTMAHAILGKSNDSPDDTMYFYNFAYRGTCSKTSSVIGSNENIGVTHGDDMIYLMPSTQKCNQSESDGEMIDTMIDLWTSFADTGIPSTKRLPDSNFWKPYGDNADYLKIGNNLDPSLSRDNHFDFKALDFLNRIQFDATFGSYYKSMFGGR